MRAAACLVAFALVAALPGAAAAQRAPENSRPPIKEGLLFLGGFSSGLFLHEAAHIVTGAALGARPRVDRLAIPLPFFVVHYDAVSRRREFAIQSSLGGSRWRLAWQSIIGSLVLSLAGGALGAALGVIALRFIQQILPENLPRLHQIGLNWPVLGYTFLVASLAGLIAGLVPALQATRVPPGEVLKQFGATAGAPGGHRRLSRSFLVVQRAVLRMTRLLTSVGLLLRAAIRSSRSSIARHLRALRRLVLLPSLQSSSQRWLPST